MSAISNIIKHPGIIGKYINGVIAARNRVRPVLFGKMVANGERNQSR